MDEKFKEYFRKRYPWTKDTPVENCPWFHQDLAVWEACKEAYRVDHCTFYYDEAAEVTEKDWKQLPKFQWPDELKNIVKHSD